MKKFTLLPVGECFEYQGEQYSKTGPLIATNLKDNHRRMIPRSAMVMPLTDTAVPPPPDTSKSTTLDAASTLAAFEHYHCGCLDWLRLAEKEMSSETTEQIRTAMEQARQRFIQDLGLS